MGKFGAQLGLSLGLDKSLAEPSVAPAGSPGKPFQLCSFLRLGCTLHLDGTINEQIRADWLSDTSLLDIV
jgi:hypothetical protein